MPPHLGCEPWDQVLDSTICVCSPHTQHAGCWSGRRLHFGGLDITNRVVRLRRFCILCLRNPQFQGRKAKQGPQHRPRALLSEQVRLSRAAPAGTALQEAGREHDRRGLRAAGRLTGDLGIRRPGIKELGCVPRLLVLHCDVVSPASQRLGALLVRLFSLLAPHPMNVFRKWQP